MSKGSLGPQVVAHILWLLSNSMFHIFPLNLCTRCVLLEGRSFRSGIWNPRSGLRQFHGWHSFAPLPIELRVFGQWFGFFFSCLTQERVGGRPGCFAPVDLKNEAIEPSSSGSAQGSAVSHSAPLFPACYNTYGVSPLEIAGCFTCIAYEAGRE